MKNRIKGGVGSAVLAWMLCTAFSLTVSAADTEMTYNPEAVKVGYHLETLVTFPCYHTDNNQAKTVSCELSGLNRSREELQGAIRVSEGLSVIPQFTERPSEGSGNNEVSNLVLNVNVVGMGGYELAGNYLCKDDGYAAYAYYRHYFSYCKYTETNYFVASEHTWLGCARGDIGVEEYHPYTYFHIVSRYKFVPNKYEIVFSGNGATAGSMKNQSMIYDIGDTLNANTYKKTGCRFKGWNTKKDGTGTVYKDTQNIKNLTEKNNGKITLYAQWEANGYMIRYHGNGAVSGSMQDQSAVFNKSVVLAENTYKRTGYIFTGWNTAANGAGSAYQDRQRVKNLAEQQNGIILLYAQWKPISYTIQFDGNGASTGVLDDIQVFYDQEVQLPANLFARETEHGTSVFVGWNRDPDMLEPEFAEEEIIKNLTVENGAVVLLCAIWDDCPMIDACDRYFTLKAAKEGKITEEELLHTASGTDREDRVLEKRTAKQIVETGAEGSISLYGYDAEDFKRMVASGSIRMNYRAVDRIGNKVYKMVTIYITCGDPMEKTEFMYTRFLNEKYYEAEENKGGLHKESVWRKNVDYINSLKQVFQNLRKHKPEQVYTLSPKEVEKIKKDSGWQAFHPESK